MERSSLVSLIIPCYFLDELYVAMTNACLMSVGEVGEVIVVDDGSPVNPKKLANVDKLIRLPENSGYSVASNAGLKAAEGQILVVANNDIVFHDNWLTELLMPLHVGYDVATVWTSDQKYILEDRLEKNARFGSLFAMKRQVYEAIGGFDEQFRGYFADTDYHRRMIDDGFKIARNNSSVVEHQAKATYAKTDPDDIEFKRAKILFERKWGYGED